MMSAQLHSMSYAGKLWPIVRSRRGTKSGSVFPRLFPSNRRHIQRIVTRETRRKQGGGGGNFRNCAAAPHPPADSWSGLRDLKGLPDYRTTFTPNIRK